MTASQTDRGSGAFCFTFSYFFLTIADAILLEQFISLQGLLILWSYETGGTPTITYIHSYTRCTQTTIARQQTDPELEVVTLLVGAT